MSSVPLLDLISVWERVRNKYQLLERTKGCVREQNVGHNDDAFRAKNLCDDEGVVISFGGLRFQRRRWVITPPIRKISFHPNRRTTVIGELHLQFWMTSICEISCLLQSVPKCGGKRGVEGEGTMKGHFHLWWCDKYVLLRLQTLLGVFWFDVTYLIVSKA